MRAKPLVLVTACGLVALFAGCGKSGTIVVAADRTWTDSGIEVRAGQELGIVAEGRVEAGPALSCGPHGFADRPEWKRYSVVAEAPHIGLIGRIGPNGPPFYVGEKFTGPADRNGTLFLGINDRDAGNNHGSFSAQVTLR